MSQAPPAAEAPPLLRLSGIVKQYGAATALHPIDLAVEKGSFTAILGPSGCGKSTLLRLIAGFAEPNAGRVEIDGRDVTRLGPEKRPTNMVFQGYGLFPHMTVAENVGFGLAIARRPRAEIVDRVAKALALVRLEAFAGRRIHALSGGQQQRVALARALIMRPLILLLDEPLAALDLKLRQAMQAELRRIHKETRGTFIFVTHDQGEAFSLADNLVVMNQGRIEQIGRPQDIYMRPNTLFVSQFVGDTNILKAMRRAGTVELAIGPRFASAGADGEVTFVLRPEAVRIYPAPSATAYAPSTAVGGPSPPLRRGGSDGADGRDVDPPPPELVEGTGEGDHAKRGGGGDDLAALSRGTRLQGTIEDLLLLGGEARVTVVTESGHQLFARLANPRFGDGLAAGMPVAIGWSDDALSEIGGT